jgi:uncharacterized membrane protein YphA (DoxX/SURF4 family)
MIVRVLLGLVFIYHGYNKIRDTKSWIKVLESKGISSSISSSIAIFAICLELILGILFCLGLFTQQVAIGLSIYLIAYIIIIHFGKQIKMYLYEIFLLLTIFLFIFHGAGEYSLDHHLRQNFKELDAIIDKKQRADRLVELNVVEQVHDLGKTSIVQNAWKREQPLHIHGWVYDVKDGIIKDLDVNFKGTNDLHSVFHLD